MTRTELERRLKLPMRALVAAGISAGDIEIAQEILLDEIEKILREAQDEAVKIIARSVRGA